ncbi:MAG: hypothetical protein WHS87_05015 [Anaerolineales bacterium]
MSLPQMSDAKENESMKTLPNSAKLLEEPINFFRQGVDSYAVYLKPDGELFDPVFEEPTQYGSAYYALCNAILANNLPMNSLYSDYFHRARNGLIFALKHVSNFNDPPTASGFRRDTGEIYRFNHRDFFWPPILKTYRLLKKSQAFAVKRFAKQIANVSIEQSFSSRPPSNVAAVWLLGEWLRFCEGFSPYPIEQFDKWLETFFAERIAIERGLYLEPGYPNSYDLFTRYHLAEILVEGYHGKLKDLLEKLLVTGLQRSLDLQLSDGSLASGHRSTGQTWTLGVECAFFTLAAGYFRNRDLRLAEKCIDAAQRAYSAMRRWQRADGPYSPVENCLPPTYRVGYEIYTADGHYGPLALSFLGTAIGFGFEFTDKNLDLRPPSFRVERYPICRGIIHHGRYSLHINANPASEYDGFGIVDVTFGAGRYFHFVSSVKNLETGRLFNLGLAHRDSPGLSRLTIIAQQPSELIGVIEKHNTPASLCLQARIRGESYSYVLLASISDEIYVSEITHGLRNYKTLLIPYLRDSGTGVITEVKVIQGGVSLIHGSEEIRVSFHQPVERILDLPYGFENRRGLCGLIRVDFQDRLDGIDYCIKVIR